MESDQSDLWLIIINPVSAAGKGEKRWPQLKKSLEVHDIPYYHRFSKDPEDVLSLIREGYDKGIRQFGILGGDGSLNTLVNAVMTLDGPLEDIGLALFPAGTGNDWRRTHRLRDDPDHVVQLISEDRFVSHDIARVEGSHSTSWYINLLGAGLDAEAVEVYHGRMSGLPIGKLKYMLSLLYALIGYRRKQATITCDDHEVYKGKFLNLNLAIGEYSGGGLHTVPHADFRDGKLEMVLVPYIPFLKILFNLPGLFNGKYIELKEVRTFQGERVHIQFAKPNPMEADGEMIGRAEEFTIHILPRVLRVISGLAE